MQNCTFGTTHTHFTLNFSFSTNFSGLVVLIQLLQFFNMQLFVFGFIRHPTAIQERKTPWMHITLTPSPGVERQKPLQVSNASSGAFNERHPLQSPPLRNFQFLSNPVVILCLISLTSPTNENLWGSRTGLSNPLLFSERTRLWSDQRHQISMSDLTIEEPSLAYCELIWDSCWIIVDRLCLFITTSQI